MSSTVPKPVPANEQEILRKVVSIRDKLTALKQDRSTYLKSSDVNFLYEQLIEQIRKINKIRQDPAFKDEQNRLDVVLDDVFQLLSLSFLTVGITRAAPSTYASLTTVLRLLHHLKESKVYSNQDLQPIRKRLDEIKDIVNRGDTSSESEDITDLIKTKVALCENLLRVLEQSLEDISPDLIPILQQLISLRRQIMAVGSKKSYSVSELKPLREKLRDIENRKVDGCFLSPDGNIPSGQSVVNAQMEACYDLLSDFTAQQELVAPSLRHIYDQLIQMKSELDSLLLTHRWTLRETDLYNYQQRLEAIDDERVNGLFLDDHGNAPEGQSILLYLLRRCYATIYRLLISSEPVSEALTPIQNQLSTVRRCLLEVKRMGGLSSARELYPYQMKLSSIDNMRTDGKFMVGNTIPEGQGLLNALLAECFDLTHELRVEMEEDSSDKDN